MTNQGEKPVRTSGTEWHTGRLFDPVCTSSQPPAALRFRTFNSRLVRGAVPPPISYSRLPFGNFSVTGFVGSGAPEQALLSKFFDMALDGAGGLIQQGGQLLG